MEPAVSQKMRAPPELPRLAIAWRVLLVADLGVIIYGLLLAVFPTDLLGAGIESHTGESLSALESSEPDVAAYLVPLARLLGAFNVAFGVMAVSVVMAAFRQGEGWSWYALLVGNTFAYGSSVAWDLTVGAISFFEILEFVLAALVLLMLALTALDFLVRQPEAAEQRS